VDKKEVYERSGSIIEMPKGRTLFTPGHGTCVKTLVCGRVISGETRYVEKLKLMHAKRCELCRNCKDNIVNIGIVEPEMPNRGDGCIGSTSQDDFKKSLDLVKLAEPERHDNEDGHLRASRCNQTYEDHHQKSA